MRQRVNTERIDQILSSWQDIIGSDFAGYRNHVVRMATFCLMLKECTPEEQQKVEIAACFHDIGIWTDNTLDYLEPSIPPAKEYLHENDLTDWTEEIKLMILKHHKIRKIDGYDSLLIELFRKGDLVDFSLGLVRFGLSKEQVRGVKKQYPNEGFHKMLLSRSAKRFMRHPLNPLPMMKW